MDTIDRELIALLRDNARTPVLTLAKKLKVARATVQNRITRLEEQGVIIGYTVRLRSDALDQGVAIATGGRIAGGMERLRRMVRVDQKPIGRTPRSNLATYTGLFDHVRKLFAASPDARRRRFDAGHFSFNVAKGRCPTCEGEGQVMVELLFLPSVYTPCPACEGARYNERVLAVRYLAAD